MTSQPDIGPGPLRLLAGHQIWDRITPLLRTRDDIFAALAHIGSNADALIPLQAGATIITDASEASVREGATDPEVLLAWVRRGVKVFSLPGLNAKVILAEGNAAAANGAEGTPVEGNSAFAVIGSADPSWSSAHTYYEAAILTDDPDSVAELRTTLVAWLNQTNPRAPLAESWLEQAIEFYGADLLGDSDGQGAPVMEPPAAAATAPAPVPSAAPATPLEQRQAALEQQQTPLDQPSDAGQPEEVGPTAAAVEAVEAISPLPQVEPQSAETPPGEPESIEPDPVAPPIVEAVGAEPLPPFEFTWKRPAGIFLSPMDSAGLPSAGAMEILAELHEEEGLPFDVDNRGHSTGDHDFSLQMFWWDETGDFNEKWKFPQGRFVVPLQTMGRRMGAAAKASPPGLVRHCYTDHSSNPPRTYYYVLVRNSAVRNVTFKDIQQNFAAIGAKPEFDSCFWVQTKIDALLDLWPDIQYDD